jgi:hypothetical protein
LSATAKEAQPFMLGPGGGIHVRSAVEILSRPRPHLVTLDQISREVTFNGQTDNAATYQVNGHKLTFKTTLNPVSIDVHASQGGTQVDNVSGHNLWIG